LWSSDQIDKMRAWRGFPSLLSNVNTPLHAGTWLPAEQETVRSELHRVVSSSCFRKSPRLIRFLQFVVESTLRGEAHQLKEYRIGVDVFGCSPLYDPRLNPVVRLEARRLRAKLELYNSGEGIADAVHIHIPKGHYSAVFELRALEIAPDTAATGLRMPVDSGTSDTLPPARNLVRNGAILLSIALIALGVYWWHSRRVPPSARTPSLAVLPFLNLTEKPENEWLSDGLADDLTDSLARVPGLRVVARGSAFRFKDSAEDVQVIAKQLNVTEVLAGSLQTIGDRLRITVQLVRADGYQVWAETYEPHDTFVIEETFRARWERHSE
jgi:TolB-like protein